MDISNNMLMLHSIFKSNQNISENITRLSTGLRINGASDDPAGLTISSRLESQSSGYNVGTRNLQDGASLARTADGALDQATNVLHRMRELSIQANNGTLNAQDKATIQNEITQLKSEYDHITSTTNFNNKSLLNQNQTLNINTGSGNMNIQTYDLSSQVGGQVDLESIDVTTNAQGSIQSIDAALESVNQVRSEYGATLNRIDYGVEQNNQSMINAESARSRIEDANFAKEISELTKNNILAQANIKAIHVQDQSEKMMLQLLK